MLDSDYDNFIGKGRVSNADGNALVRLASAPLVLKPGTDFALSTGLASGVSGNFNLQLNVTLDNTLGTDYSSCLLYIVCVNSGFFESQGGSSRVIRGPLTQSDVISASTNNQIGSQKLKRMVGGGFFDSLSSHINKAKDLYEKSKPMVSMVKNALPDGKIKGALSMAGYGKNGDSRKMSDRFVQ